MYVCFTSSHKQACYESISYKLHEIQVNKSKRILIFFYYEVPFTAATAVKTTW